MSEITPVAILLLLVTSCVMPLFGILFLCPTAQEPPPPPPPQKKTHLSSLPLTLFIQLSKDRNDLSCQGASATSARMALPPVSAGLLSRLY